MTEERKKPVNERWEAFGRIWVKGKQNKMVQRLMSKVEIRGLEPTEENCRDYWMGYIRFYKDSWTGQDYHINPRKNKVLMKQLKRNRYENETRGKRYKGKPYTVGRRNNKKNSKIRRRK
tara:strand:- start:559 stop:915 length:357 start_codon:yes stop_codon:yes gene_type:complete